MNKLNKNKKTNINKDNNMNKIIIWTLTNTINVKITT